ncbi:MAG TPA: aldo/keto reductase [Nitrospirota bacterium]|nr:aldo/keto reductase [Nitrospirota bacterium]
MHKRKLGNSGIETAPLALGGNVFGWTVDEPMAFKICDAFSQAGLNLIDTADSYSKWVAGNRGGESETIIGKWLKRSGRRNEIIIATKVGSEMGQTKRGLSKAYILHAVEESLKRLQTDHIDLYQSHYDDPDTPMEETLAAYGELVKQGKVRTIGASNFSASRLSMALRISKDQGLPAYECLQPRYNLYDRADYEQALEPLCRTRGLGVITYYSLASGFLTGKYRSEKDLSISVRGQGIKLYLNARGLRILDALDEVAKRFDTVPSSVALAWLMGRPGITAPIASATTLEQLNDLIAATKLELDQESLGLLTKASDN